MMTRDEFIRNYCERTGVTWEWLSGPEGNQVALRCACGEVGCLGWAMVTNEPLSLKAHTDLYAPRVTLARGDRVRKRSGSTWEGIVVGEYSTSLTPEGYAVESLYHPGSVQIYPASALKKVTPTLTNERKHMNLEDSVTALMALVEKYGEMREWHGARPGDDTTGRLNSAKDAVRNALRRQLLTELATLIPAIAQLEVGNSAGALKMLQRRAECVAGPISPNSPAPISTPTT